MDLKQQLQQIASREEKVRFVRANKLHMQMQWDDSAERYRFRVVDSKGGPLDQFDCSRGNVARVLGKTSEQEVIEHLKKQGLSVPKEQNAFEGIAEGLKSQFGPRRRIG